MISSVSIAVRDEVPKLTLRSVAMDDAGMLLGWRNSPNVSRYMYTNHTIGEIEHIEWLGRAISDDSRSDFVILVDDRAVGLVTISAIDTANSRAEWAFYIADPAVRGKGVGSAVEFWALTHVFDRLMLNRLSCAVLGFNVAVAAMHESFGFTREGLLREHVRRSDGVHDVLLFGMLRSEWGVVRDRHAERIRLVIPDVGLDD